MENIFSDCDELAEFFDEDMDYMIVDVILERDLNTKPKKNSGSRIGRSPNIDRGLAMGHRRIWQDYLSPSPVYDENCFRRRFRMSSRLFRRLLEDVPTKNSYFRQRRDATGKLGASAVQKITAGVRMLAYGIAADAIDEYARLGESTILQSMKEFTATIIVLYGAHYLRSPNAADIFRIQKQNEARGFPGMLGSIDCMHWFWKNCPKAWQGQMIGKDGQASLVLEAVATYDLHIWHAFFGMPGSCNDINILNRSPLMVDIISGKIPPSEFSVNGKTYPQGYFLADGIYPTWPIFVSGFSQPDNEKKRYFTKLQESCRKDVERAFGVLQQRFHIISRPSNLWLQEDMTTTITACIILHNMIVEDQASEGVEQFEAPVNAPSLKQFAGKLDSFADAICDLKSRTAHLELRSDLVDYQWQKKGSLY
jgi:hypothetical protein